MPNPFDWRTVLLAKHAQHVALIHFPIALFIVGVIFDVCATWTKKQTFATVAFFNLGVAALSVPPVLLTGVAAWRWQLEAQPMKGILLYHVVAAVFSAVIIVAGWWAHYRGRRNNCLPSWRLPLELAGVGLLMVTGHLGGFLSGVNG
ncbi:MAG TPA: DUF2231 domain-containing protein [Candidatus Sulfotelmatobacter sp.]|nr:DUF2231 domain-containing protein [Candidatus Sulfotelmatobacter sp.]